VLVTGSTRSGTSTAAGSLHHLGLHVPLPVLEANESNPSGFFESTWPIAFHRRLLDRALVSPTDARPDAFGVVARVVTDDDRGELRGWLGGAFGNARQVVVKDPRAAWVPRLWLDAAGELGASVGLLLMVRHPAEVVASRTTYYHAGRPDSDAWRYRIRSLCTWINLNTGVEQATRGCPRVVARYDDLLADWRRVVDRVRDVVGLDIDLGVDSDAARAVDAFIDPGLRRHQPSWEGMDLPTPLVEIADAVWQAISDEADGRHEPGAVARIDELRDAYAAQVGVARAIAHDASVAMVRRDRLARSERQAQVPAGNGAPQPAASAGPGRVRLIVRRWTPMRLRQLVSRVRD
jgi:hypothetical protein